MNKWRYLVFVNVYIIFINFPQISEKPSYMMCSRHFSSNIFSGFSIIRNIQRQKIESQGNMNTENTQRSLIYNKIIYKKIICQTEINQGQP